MSTVSYVSVAGDGAQTSSAESTAEFNLIPNIPQTHNCSKHTSESSPINTHQSTRINEYRRLLQLPCMFLRVSQTGLNT